MERERMVREYRDLLRSKNSELLGQEAVLKNISRRFKASDSWEVEKEIRMTIKETSREIRRLEKRIEKIENEIFDDEDDFNFVGRGVDVEDGGPEETTKNKDTKKMKKENRVIFIISSIVFVVITLVGVTFINQFFF